MATATTENGALRTHNSSTFHPHQLIFHSPVNDDDFGPIQEYDRRVAQGRLKNDEHQRGNFSPTKQLSTWRACTDM